ncbi:hypothetical protein D3C78_1224620 [compost metagenome]
MIKSRSGNGDPSPRKKGIENAPAKVTAPRTPEMVRINSDLTDDFSIFRRRDPTKENTYTHTNRSTNSSIVMANT